MHVDMLLCTCVIVLFFFFFFQAEDGIRDVAVTGVQTCALPICIRRRRTCGAVRGLDHRGVVDAEAGVNVPRSDFRVPTSVYAELHCHSAFSFLDGASLPEQLALTASQLGYSGLALTDHNGLYGSLAFAHDAKPHAVSRNGAKRCSEPRSSSSSSSAITSVATGHSPQRSVSWPTPCGLASWRLVTCIITSAPATGCTTC